MVKMSRGEMQDLLNMFADENPKFRQALLTNPKTTIEQQLNINLGNVQVKMLVERPDTMYVIVPFVPASDFRDGGQDDVAGASVWDVLESLGANSHGLAPGSLNGQGGEHDYLVGLV